MTPSAPILGRTLAGRFRIVELIGQGGMAAVYRGTQDAEPTELAIKIMDPELALDDKFVRRFRREAKSAAKLVHPGSVQIIDYGVEDGLPYIAMELLRGAELFAILEHERRLSETRAARLIADVCDVLEAAHAQGIVHRDLKPENIMIQRDPADPSREVIKVLDFGIAKILEPDVRLPGGAAASPADPDAPPPSSFGRTALTMMGSIVGTPEYMSPEQSRGGTIDARSDLYACGVLLYQMVTGRVPFLAELPIETAMLHVTAMPARPSSITPAIHPKLEALILSALEKSPDARPQSARELETKLRELLPELATERHQTVRPPAASDAGVSKFSTTLPALIAPPPIEEIEADPDPPEPAAAPPPAIPEAPPARATAPTLTRAAPPAPRLSERAALLLGMGLGALVLAIIALVMTRR